jgi:hypothetical protein
MKTFTNDIREYTNLIPFLGAYFILYGSVDILIYYGEFNINIINFISFGEIITYFIANTFLVIYNLLVILLGFIGLNFIQKKLKLETITQRSENIEKEEEASTFAQETNRVEEEASTFAQETNRVKEILSIAKENIRSYDIHKLNDLLNEQENILNKLSIDLGHRKKQTKKMLIPIFILGVFLLSISILAFYLFGLLFIIGMTICLFVGLYVHDAKTYFFICGLVTLLTSAGFNAYSNANKVKNGKNFGMDIEIGDQLIKSDSTNFVIGKTENYIFYYETKKNMTIVYPVNKLNYMIIPMK